MNAETASGNTHQATPELETTRVVPFENDQVLVIESTYAPGGSVPMHLHHWPHLVYVVQGGILETTGSDGISEIHEVQPGQTLWRTPQSHSTRNIGDTSVRILEIEVKQG